MLIAYPMAYYAARVVQRNRSLLVLLVIIPLWVSLLMRVFAWRMILGQNGILNSALVGSGILDQPSEAFLYTGFSVLLTYAYISIPFAFIAIFAALECWVSSWCWRPSSCRFPPVCRAPSSGSRAS